MALHAWIGSDCTELDRNLAAERESWSGEAQELRMLAEALAGAGDQFPDVPLRRQVLRGEAGSLFGEWWHSAQLVVVGDRGHRGLAGLVLGSVSWHLIFRVACPTAAVLARPPAR